MKIETDGLVIREQAVRESDKVITVLTGDRGVITAYAAGAKNIKNSKCAATSLLTYSQFNLYKGHERYTVDDAHSKELFIDMRTDIDKLSLAQYFCELAAVVVPEGENSKEILRLALNSLYLLNKGSRPNEFLKAVFELRLMALCGFMPNLICCAECGSYEHEQMRFYPDDGTLLCGDCAGITKKHSIITGMGATTAMRHCIYAEFDKLFAFSLSESSLPVFERAAEEFTLAQLGRGFKTLDFYKMIKT